MDYLCHYLEFHRRAGFLDILQQMVFFGSNLADGSTSMHQMQRQDSLANCQMVYFVEL